MNVRRMTAPGRRARVAATFWMAVAASFFGSPVAAKGLRQATAPATALTMAINQVDLSDYPKLKLYVTVTSRDGRPVQGLTAAAFNVSEDGMAKSPLDVSSVGAVTQADPVRIVLALDTSQSVQNAKALDTIKDAAISFVEDLSPRDKIALLQFNSQVTEVQTFTNNSQVIKDRIRGLQAGGGTALYEVVHRAAEMVAGQSGRRAVVILTDGWNDTSLPRTLTQAAKTAVDANAPTFVIGFGTPHHEALTQIAEETGGTYLRTGSAGAVKDLFTQITGLLANQYILTYDTSLTADSKSHDFKAVVERDGARAEDTKSLLITPASLLIAVGPATTAVKTGVPGPSPTPVKPSAVAGCLQTDAHGACICMDANGDGVCDKSNLPWILGALFAALVLGWLFMARRRESQPSYNDDWGNEGAGTMALGMSGGDATQLPGAMAVGGAPSASSATIVTRAPQAVVAWLIGLDGEVLNRRYALNSAEQATTTFGRAPESSHVIEGGGTVSRQHAHVRCEHGQFVLRDMGARNPVKVNGQGITRHVLVDGDQIEMGSARFVFKRGQAGRSGQGAKSS